MKSVTTDPDTRAQRNHFRSRVMRHSHRLRLFPALFRSLRYIFLVNIVWGLTTAFGQVPSKTLHAFGDSLTFGGKASSFEATSFIPLVSSALSWRFVNNAHPGDQAADAGSRVYSEVTNSTDIYSLEVGVNDEWIYEADAPKRAIFAGAHLAELAWLSLPASRKMTAHDDRLVFTGEWRDSSLFPGIGRQSSQAGASVSFAVFGSAVLVGISQSDNAGGCSIGLTIDDVSYGRWNSASSSQIKTYLGTTFAPLLIRQAGLTPSTHRVRLNVSDCRSAGASAFFDWAAGVGTIGDDPVPRVYTLNIPRKAANFYARYPGGGDANVAGYNALISENVSKLLSDGLPVMLLDIFSALNTTSDLDQDGIHPNDRGHALIGRTFLQNIDKSLGTLAKPSLRSRQQ